jgi:hypothetical protein
MAYSYTRPYGSTYGHEDDPSYDPASIGDPIALDPLGGINDRPKFKSRKDRERTALDIAERGRDASSTKPLGHWTQALAQVLEGGVAGYDEAQLAKDDATRRDYLTKALEGNTSPDDLMKQGALYDVPELSDIGKYQAETDWRRQTYDTDQSWKQKSYDLQKQEADRKAADLGLTELSDGTLIDNQGRIHQPTGGDRAAPQAKIGDVLKVSDDVRALPAYKAYSASLPIYNSAMQAADTPSGDLQVINAAAKIFDPGSVVMVGEEEKIRENANIPDKIKQWAAYISGGSRLTTKVRNELLHEAKTRILAQKAAFDAAMGQYSTEQGGMLEQYHIQPEHITPRFPEIWPDPETQY